MIPESIAIPTGLTGLANHQPVHASSFITCTIVLYLHLLRLVSTDELRVFGFLRQLQDTSIPLASYSFSFFLCPHRVMRVVDHSKNARTPCLKYANFTQNTQNLRKLRKIYAKHFCVRTPKFWVVNPSEWCEWSAPQFFAFFLSCLSRKNVEPERFTIASIYSCHKRTTFPTLEITFYYTGISIIARIAQI